MKHVTLRVFLLACALLGLFASQALAQEATIVGTITDPSGAIVPDATVSITNTETGQAGQFSTNAAGQFVAPALRIGRYTVRVQASGFKAVERRDIVLNVGDRVRLDFKLELGTVSDVVTVEAAPIAVQTDSGEISDIVTGQQVTQLAANGRSIYSLAALMPGASSMMPSFQIPTPVGGNANVSFNGQRPGHNIYLADGGENLDRGGAGTFSIQPSVDAVAEFRAMTSNYSAEYGLSSAATFSLVFKSGTQQFHGSAWEFLRNDALDAGNYFTNAAGKSTPKLRFHTFGFNFGGPVTLGKLYNKEREKTFFFYNMEWRRLIQGGSLNRTVPLTSTYGGNFGSTPLRTPCASQLSASEQARFAAAGVTLSTCDANGVVQNAAYFVNNTIPSSLLDPNAQSLLNAGIFPAPTVGAQYIGGTDSPTTVREELVRIDHRFNDKFSVFGHWVSEHIMQTFGTSMWSGDNVPTVGNTFGNPSYSAVIHSVHSISPSLINETALNYNGNRISITPQGVIERPSGFNVPELFDGNNMNRIPQIALAGATGATFDVSSWPWHNKADDYQIRDDISWVRGAHQLKMGASYALYKKIQDLFGQTQGAFTFNGMYTGNDFADFLLGYASQYNELAVQDKGYWNNVSLAAYIQDNWRVSNRLTLNLGLRWDGAPHTYEANNRMGNFYPELYDPAKAAILSADGGSIAPNSPGLGTSPNPLMQGMLFYLNGIGIPGQNGIPKGLVNNHWASFGPRIGFAFDLTGQGRTILRGGFGTMYERVQGNDMYNAGPNIPFSSAVSFNNVSLSNPNRSLRTGNTLTAPITIANITGLSRGDYKNPTTYQFSLGVQQSLGAKSVLSVSYVGAQGRHQSAFREINVPDPAVLPGLIAGTTSYNTVVPYRGFGSIQLAENAQNTNYNSLQVNLRSQIKNDLTLQVAYTAGRAMDPTGGAGNGFDLNAISNPYDRSYDHGRALFNRTHVALVNFIYDIPVFRHNSNAILKNALGGWQLSGIVTAQTGLPLNIVLGGSQGGNGLRNSTNRPNVSGDVTYPKSITEWFDTSVFSAPAVGAWGNLERNSVTGPGQHNWNLSLFKSVLLNEARGSRLEFRAETFNTFNHTQFNAVSSTYSNADFGHVTSVFDPRTIQLGMKLYF